MSESERQARYPGLFTFHVDGKLLDLLIKPGMALGTQRFKIESRLQIVGWWQAHVIASR